jgi:hypothetical protein
MSDTGQHRRPDLKVLKGGGRAEARALERLLGQRHGWLLKLAALSGVLAAGTFLLIPAFDRRVPRLTAEEVAAAMAATADPGPVVTELVEALDLDPAQARVLQQTLARFDAEALEPRRSLEAALAVLRGAAAGSPAEAVAVDEALVQRRQARARLEVLDAELVEAVAAGLTPSQKARAALALGHHLQRGEDARQAAPAGPPPATTAPAARP